MLSWIAVSIAALPAFAAPYCGVDELPDLIKCLPAPPEPGSADFARDVARYEWGKEQRKDPEASGMHPNMLYPSVVIATCTPFSAPGAPLTDTFPSFPGEEYSTEAHPVTIAAKSAATASVVVLCLRGAALRARPSNLGMIVPLPSLSRRGAVQ